MDVAAVLEITAAETDVDATLSGSCCFYAAVAAAMVDVLNITTADVVSAITAACGSSFSYAAAVVSATADVETDAANSSFTLFPI